MRTGERDKRIAITELDTMQYNLGLDKHSQQQVILSFFFFVTLCERE